MINEAEDSIVTEIIKQLFQEMKFCDHEVFSSLSFERKKVPSSLEII